MGVHPRGAVPESLGLRFEKALNLDELNCDCNVDRKEVCRAMAPSNLKGPEGFILRLCGLRRQGRSLQAHESPGRDVSIWQSDQSNVYQIARALGYSIASHSSLIVALKTL